MINVYIDTNLNYNEEAVSARPTPVLAPTDEEYFMLMERIKSPTALQDAKVSFFYKQNGECKRGMLTKAEYNADWMSELQSIIDTADTFTYYELPLRVREYSPLLDNARDFNGRKIKKDLVSFFINKKNVLSICIGIGGVMGDVYAYMVARGVSRIHA